MLTMRIPGVLLLVLLAGLLALAACGGEAATSTAPTAPPASAAQSGDATRGQALFTSAGCVGCHSTGTNQLVGPGLAGVVAGKGPYGDKLPNGEPISDENMMKWIKVGGIGKIGQMPGHNTLSDQELADLVAYLKTLE